MNVAKIKELAEIMNSAGLTLLEIEGDGVSVKMEKAPPPQIFSPVPAGIPMPAAGPFAHSPISGAPAAELRAEDMDGKLVKSPTVGVYYASPSPDGKPYVQVGSLVKNGDVLCIIEAMKLMNEITADCDGEVVEVLAGNGQVVEYGQPLFRIKQ